MQTRKLGLEGIKVTPVTEEEREANHARKRKSLAKAKRIPSKTRQKEIWEAQETQEMSGSIVDRQWDNKNRQMEQAWLEDKLKTEKAKRLSPWQGPPCPEHEPVDKCRCQEDKEAERKRQATTVATQQADECSERVSGSEYSSWPWLATSWVETQMSNLFDV